MDLAARLEPVQLPPCAPAELRRGDDSRQKAPTEPRPRMECCPCAYLCSDRHRTAPSECRVLVSERTFSITELVPQSRRGPGLFCNVHPACLLLGKKVDQERFHNARQIVRNPFDLSDQILSQGQINRALPGGILRIARQLSG